jgi:2-polyprenyl-6-methoxyphenol hydroxylase-like FAD-dependent oxidoreductase
MVASPSVLVVGAGVAGSTVAWCLARANWRVTVVERAAALRSSGAPVDVRGPAVPVVERMGVLPRLRAAATRTTRLEFVDDRGRCFGAIPQQWGAGTEIELSRGDLTAALAAAGADDVERCFGDTVVALHDDGDGVDVEFAHAARRRFDLVIGADGVHSRVRELVFGPESRFVEHLGFFVATLTLDEPAAHPDAVLLHSIPGRSVAVHPATERSLVAFFFRGPALPDLDHRAIDRHKRLVTAAFAGGGWRVPELLDRVHTADDLYFDAVSRVRTGAWSRGRVALLGDAASCASLLGDGSSMAIAGAAVLADALAAHPHPATALRAYEAAHRPLVEARQRGVGPSAALLVPATRGGLAARNLALRLMPLGASQAALRRWTAGDPAAPATPSAAPFAPAAS